MKNVLAEINKTAILWSRLFVTVSKGDLYDIPQLYELPKEKGWEYVSHSSSASGNVQVVFLTTIPGANIDQEIRNSWVPKTYTVTVGKEAKYEVSTMLNKSEQQGPAAGTR